MNILFIGDIVGRPGRRAVKERLEGIVAKEKIDVVIANGENLAAGLGFTEDTYREMMDAGVQFMTAGNHTWDKKEFNPLLDQRDTRVIRPANVDITLPGRGWDVIKVGEKKLMLINIMGRVFIREQSTSPFETIDRLLQLPEAMSADAILVDIHAEATSEKNCFGYWLDGRVSAVVGTHTHVQTADERILPKGTGYITDVGMTGPIHSSIGGDLGLFTKGFIEQVPVPFEVAKGPVVFSAVVIKGARRTRAKSIKRLFLVD